MMPSVRSLPGAPQLRRCAEAGVDTGQPPMTAASSPSLCNRARAVLAAARAQSAAERAAAGAAAAACAAAAARATAAARVTAAVAKDRFDKDVTDEEIKTALAEEITADVVETVMEGLGDVDTDGDEDGL